jgi:hypothetical protein
MLAAMFLGYAEQAHAERYADRQFTQAVSQYRAGRYSDAFGRLLQLATEGDADAARIVLFMHHFGPQLYGSYWDLNSQQVADFTRLATTAARHREAAFQPTWEPAGKSPYSEARRAPRSRVQ